MSIDAAPAGPPQKNRRGLIALILGIVAVVLAVIPFASYGAWLIGIAAIVLGILAIIRPGFARGTGIAGIALGAIAILLSIVASIAYTIVFALAAASAAPSGYAFQSDGAPVGGSGASHQVVYSITGSGRASTIVYYSVSGGQSGQATLQDEKLPWSKTVTVRGALDSASSVLTVVGQQAGSGEISCSISVDGEVVSTQDADGRGSFVQCVYRPGS